MTVNIATDSIADLPSHVIQELGIILVPPHTHFGAEIHRGYGTIEYRVRVIECATVLGEAEMLTEQLGSKFPKVPIYRSRVTPVIQYPYQSLSSCSHCVRG
ncbi:hypothetical protein ACFLUJ_02445 [Chloroflexota bacterium]